MNKTLAVSLLLVVLVAACGGGDPEDFERENAPDRPVESVPAAPPTKT